MSFLFGENFSKNRVQLVDETDNEIHNLESMKKLLKNTQLDHVMSKINSYLIQQKNNKTWS